MKGSPSPSSSTPGTGRDTLHSPACSFSSLVVVITDQELFPSFSIHFLVPLLFLAAKSRIIFLLSVGREEEGAAGEGDAEEMRVQEIPVDLLQQIGYRALLCRFLDRWKWNLPGAGGWHWVFLKVHKAKPCCHSVIPRNVIAGRCSGIPPASRECIFCLSRTTFP